jgi:hypothetical protein
MEKIVLRHVSVGTAFLLDGAPPPFSRHVPAFLNREFPDHWIGRSSLLG